MRAWLRHKWLRFHYHSHFHPHTLPVLLLLAFAVGTAYAGSIAGASLTLTDPRPAQGGVSYQLAFSVESTTPIQSFQAEVCTTNIGPCTTPGSFSAAAATFAGQPSGFGDSAGWLNDSTTGSLRLKKPTNLAPPAGSQSVSFDNVTNPDPEGTYYVRLTSYSDAAYTNAIDSSTIALLVTRAVTVTVTVDPSLSFNVSGIPPSTVYKGALATSDRCVDTASSITFGTSGQPLAPNTDYDCAQTLTASTNASSGYQVTVMGVVPGDDLINTANNTISVPDWSATNSNPAATPGSPAELFGYTTNDGQLTGVPDRFTASDNLFAGLTTAADEVAYANTPVASRAVNVAWRLRFTFYSNPGTYQGRVIYTCTSTF